MVRDRYGSRVLVWSGSLFVRQSTVKIMKTAGRGGQRGTRHIGPLIGSILAKDPANVHCLVDPGPH